MASLHVRVLGANSQEQHYLLEKEETILGRNPDCDVVVPCIHASRRHARIIRVSDRFYVEDMTTLGGTRVNGPEVRNQIRERTLLQDKNEIWFADQVVVQFRE
jgi:pSer/pThr/pTyr-binding forkhead associated (FHA) protein